MDFRIKARGEGDLKTRYRPKTLTEICPTFNMKDAQAILQDPNASQVWLFEGNTGCGKTSLARIIARAAVCESEGELKPCLECDPCKAMETQPDFLEINGADLRTIEAMRAITPDMRQWPVYLDKRVFIFDEAQQITRPAQELLNKELEEPTESTLIFLCTTNKKGLIKTLLDRCAKLTFKRLTSKQAAEISNQVLVDLGKEMLDKTTHDDMVRRADGSVRAFLNLLDSYVRGSYKIGSDSVDSDVHEGSPDIFALVKGLIEKDWPTVRDILRTDNVKNDPDGYRETICFFLARDGLNQKFDTPRTSIAQVLNILGGSLWEEPKREQHSLLVLRCMKACMRK